MKKRIFLIILLTLVLSGCTFSKNKTKMTEEIIFQENTSINSLQDFIKKAQTVAIEKLGSDAELKMITFVYHRNSNYFSYSSFFVNKNEKLSSEVLKNLTISYNTKWTIVKNPKEKYVDSYAENNNLIGLQCANSNVCITSVNELAGQPSIKPDDVKINLNNLIKNYKTDNDFEVGMIVNSQGIIQGTLGVNFIFNALTSDVVDKNKVDIDSWIIENSK